MSFEALKHEGKMMKEFFRKFKAKISNSAIPEIFTTDNWDFPGGDTRPTVATDDGIRRELRKYCKWLYQERKSIRDPELEATLETQTLNEHDSHSLEEKVTMKELQRAIKEIGTEKSAGPDALPAEFYKSFEELVRRDFLRILNLALERVQLCVSMREGDIILLYKKGDTRDPRNYATHAVFKRSNVKCAAAAKKKNVVLDVQSQVESRELSAHGRHLR